MSHEFYPEVGLYLAHPPSGELMPISASDAFYYSDWETHATYYDFYGTYYTKYGILFDPERMAENPWIGAALFRRSIRRLWQRCSGVYDNDGRELFPPQLTKPKEALDEQWEFLAWNFDERLERPFSQVIESAQMAKIKHGYAVAEIVDWKTEDTPFGRRVVFTDLLDRDPRRFIINPRNYAKGIYRRSDMTRLPDKKFIVWTAKEKFELKCGQSEFALLIDSEYALPKIEKYERRHLERYGSPLLNLETSKASGGANRDNWRQAQAEQLRKQGNQAVIVTIKDSETLKVFEGNGETDGFENAITREIKKIGTVLLNNPTALIDGQHGSYSKEESTGARALQMNEQTDAEDIENGINYQLIPWALGFNWADVPAFPEIKILPVETITPTTPKDQETIQEIKGDEEPEKEEKEDTHEPETMAAKPEWIRNTDEIQEFIKKQIAEYVKVDESPYVVTYPEQEQTTITLPVDKAYKWDSTTQKLIVMQEEEEEEQEQEQEEDKEYTPPVAIPPTYKDFPSEEPLPEGYTEITLAAQVYLEDMPAKPYDKIQKGEEAQTFTIKRLRGFERDDELVEALKMAIVPTLEAENEMAAWVDYWRSAVDIFKKYGFEQPSPELRNDLKISFRQARQNALNEGFYQAALQDPAVVGLQLVPDPNVKTRHLDEIAWDNLVIPIDHKELQVGGRLRIPMNFGCMHTYRKIYDANLITPESDWPAEFPGRTYRYYAQPEQEQE